MGKTVGSDEDRRFCWILLLPRTVARSSFVARTTYIVLLVYV